MNEHPYFFGREKQTRELIDILKKSRFISVIGTSGSGKSSLVRAGMLPYLYKGMMSDDTGDWSICTFRPGVAPIDALVDKLFNLAKKENKNAVSKNEDFEKKWIKQTILDNNEGILHAYHQLNISGKLLLVVDQFEEIFRYKNEAENHNEMARAFVHRLINASRQNKEQIYVCITMRSDFLGDCSDFYDLPEMISKGMYLVPRLERNELRKAITAPAQLQNATVDPSLVDRLINDLEGKQDQLPLLQHALMRTFQIWKNRKAPDSYISMKDYRKSGTMDRALSDHGDSILDKIKSDHKDEIKSEEYLNIAKKLFQCITQKSGEKGIRRPASLKKISNTIEVPQSKINKVINYFRDVKNSLLMPPLDKSDPKTLELQPDTIIDISHESLMRIWHRLKDWVEEEEEKGRKYKRIYDAYQLNEEQKVYKRSTYPTGSKLKLYKKYLHDIEPTTEWAERYGGKLKQVTNFIKKSRKRENRRLFYSVGSIAFIGLFLFFSYIASNQYLRSFIECYNTEIEASKTNDQTQSFIYSSNTINILEEANDTYGKKVFNFKNWVYEIFSGNKDQAKISTDEMEMRAQKKLISAFNQGAFYCQKLDNISQFAFSHSKDFLFTINEKNVVQRWNLSDKNAPPVQYKVSTNQNKKIIPTRILVTKNDSTIFAILKNGNSANFIELKNGRSLTKKNEFTAKTLYSNYASPSKGEKYIHPDQFSKDILNVSNGEIATEVEEVVNGFPDINSISFLKNDKIALIENEVIEGGSYVFYLRFLDDDLSKKMPSSFTKSHFIGVNYFEDEDILVAEEGDSLKIWSFKDSKLLFSKKGNFRIEKEKNHLILIEVNARGYFKSKVEIIDFSNQKTTNYSVINNYLNSRYGIPEIQYGKDTTLNFPNYSKQEFLKYKLPLSKNDKGEKVKMLPFNKLPKSLYFPKKGQEFIQYIEKKNSFIEFDKNISSKNSVLSFKNGNNFSAKRNEFGDLLIFDLHKFSSSLIGHPGISFFSAGFKKDSLLAYTNQGIFSFNDSYLQPVPSRYSYIIFSNDISHLMGLHRGNNKLLDVISTGKTTRNVITLESKYSIDQFIMNDDNSKVALTSFQNETARLRIYDGENFNHFNRIYFPNYIKELGFSKQSDDLGVVMNNNTLLFLPEDFKGEKIDTTSKPNQFIVPKKGADPDTISAFVFPTEITAINSFINENKKEIWMIGLDNGEVHIMNENRSNVDQILNCGNYPISSIQGRTNSTIEEIIITDGGTIYNYQKEKKNTRNESIFQSDKKDTENEFEEFINLEATSSINTIFFNDSENEFYTLNKNGFIKKWFTDYNEIINEIDSKKIYGDIIEKSSN